jgi:DNA-binding response OmpR family regulator
MGRILIAVKEAKLRSSLSAAFKVSGNTVIEAGDAGACLEILEKQPPDGLVLDPGLPGLEASQLLRHVRRNATLASMDISLLARGMDGARWESLGRQFFDLVVEEEGATAAGALASGTVKGAGRSAKARESAQRPVKTRTLRGRGAPAESKQRILVVEDDGSYCILLGTEFQSHGWETEGADCAEAALEFLSRKGNEVEAVLSDINLPGMDGVELARRVRVGHPKVKVVLMTGMPRDRYPVPPEGVPILPKPISVKQLMAAMKFL